MPDRSSARRHRSNRSDKTVFRRIPWSPADGAGWTAGSTRTPNNGEFVPPLPPQPPTQPVPSEQNLQRLRAGTCRRLLRPPGPWSSRRVAAGRRRAATRFSRATGTDRARSFAERNSSARPLAPGWRWRTSVEITCSTRYDLALGRGAKTTGDGRASRPNRLILDDRLHDDQRVAVVVGARPGPLREQGRSPRSGSTRRAESRRHRSAPGAKRNSEA